VAALATALDDLDVDEPAVVVGHSLGVLVALRLAAAHPARVSAVVGFGPPLYADREMARRHIAGTGPMGRLFVLPGRTAEWTCRRVCTHRAIAARLAVLTHPRLPAPIAADSVRHTWVSYSETLERVLLAAEAAAWLPEVACPVRLVAGDRDPVVDLEFVRRLASMHPHVELLEWHGRHDLPLVHAARCVDLIREQAAVTSAERITCARGGRHSRPAL
jgi:pimeloyl-ACP methyl ester carboxylesterase